MREGSTGAGIQKPVTHIRCWIYAIIQREKKKILIRPDCNENRQTFTPDNMSIQGLISCAGSQRDQKMLLLISVKRSNFPEKLHFAGYYVINPHIRCQRFL